MSTPFLMALLLVNIKSPIDIVEIMQRLALVFNKISPTYGISMLMTEYFNGLVQERCNSSALAMEFRLYCTSISIFLPYLFFKL